MAKYLHVYDVAKNFNTTPGNIISICQDRGYRTVENPNSIIESHMMDKLRPLFSDIRYKQQTNLFDAVFFPHRYEKFDLLADMAEPEKWDFHRGLNQFNKPILFNYLKATYSRLAVEDKIAISRDGNAMCFNTGLVTVDQESIYLFATENHLPNQKKPIPWHFNVWAKQGQNYLSGFDKLPDAANYCEDPTKLIFDPRKPLQVDIDHIVADNLERFPVKFQSMPVYQLKNLVNGAVESARNRVRRNFKAAVPQYYRGHIQLVVPLCLSKPNEADLALVLIDQGGSYRASTCLSLEIAYNNARQIAPLTDNWLAP